MTFDEIQKTIEGMLSVQRNLQESQLNLHEKQANHEEILTRLEKTYERQQKLIDKMLSYTLSANVDIEERLRVLETKMKRLEPN
jgi:hypothetical protein